MITFNELSIYEYIEKILSDEFNKKTWRTLFGNKKMRFVNDDFGEEEAFPIIYIGITNCNEYQQTHDSSGNELYTDFTFEIECYNIEVGDLTKVKLGLQINAKVIELIRTNLNARIEQNARLESPDSSIYRRIIKGSCIYDNVNNTFYR